MHVTFTINCVGINFMVYWFFLNGIELLNYDNDRHKFHKYKSVEMDTSHFCNTTIGCPTIFFWLLGAQPLNKDKL